jgi:hypothetical protein
VPVFSEVDVVNNPYNYSVRLDYTSTGLNITIATGAVDVPVLAVPDAQTTPEDIPLVFSSGNANAITVADPGAASPLQVTVGVSHGKLTLGSTAGLTNVGGNGTASVTFRGSPAAVTAALNGLNYTPNGDYTGSDLLNLSVTNPGGTGLLGGAQTATATVAITVTPTADAPTFTLAGSNVNTFDGVAQTIPGWATNVQNEPPNTGNLTGLFFATSSDNPGLFTVQPAMTLVGNTGTLAFTPKVNTGGVAHVTVTLSNTFPDADGDTDSSSQTFTITVTNHTPPAVVDVVVHWGLKTASLLSLLALYPTRKDIPFQNINAIDLVFNQDVSITGTGLGVTGQQALDGLTGGVYRLSAPIYLANHTVEWRLNTALGGAPGIDKLALGLAAGAVHSTANGNTLASNYALNFNVLVGDTDGNGVVDVNDQLLITRNLGIRYSGISFLDLDGDGTISMLDYNISRAHNGKKLP